MATHPDYESQSKYITLKEGDNRLDFSLKPLYSGKFTGFYVKSTATEVTGRLISPLSVSGVHCLPMFVENATPPLPSFFQ